MKLNIIFNVVANNGIVFIRADDKDTDNNLAIIEKKKDEWNVTYSVLNELGILNNIDLLDIVRERISKIDKLEMQIELSLFRYDALNRMFNEAVDEDDIPKKKRKNKNVQ